VNALISSLLVNTGMVSACCCTAVAISAASGLFTGRREIQQLKPAMCQVLILAVISQDLVAEGDTNTLGTTADHVILQGTTANQNDEQG
jgi:hypothetical protein